MRHSTLRSMLLAVFLMAGLLICLAACEPFDDIFSSVEAQKQASAPHKSSQAKTGLPDYETARQLFWQSLYSGDVSSLYCGQNFNSTQRRGFNVEHVFPMSWATNGLGCGKRKLCRQRSYMFNRIEGDLHNLFPARTDINRARSSYRFGLIGGERREFGRCDFEVDARARVAEPTERVRGDVARAMFYMAHRYQSNGLKLFNKQAALLFKWHQADPPSAEEKRRNNVIEQLQGNRNLFIDQPALLNRLYEDGFFRR